MTSGFDIEQYQAELAAAEFAASRARLEAHGWTLMASTDDDFLAEKVIDGSRREIQLPSLVRVEVACAEYDERQEARAGAARERAREQQRLDRQARLEGELARSLREAEQKLAVEEALRSL